MDNTNVIPTADVFSWAVFDEKLDSHLDKVFDAKLQGVARTEDLLGMQLELQQLRSENVQLREEMDSLRKRIEQIDRNSRRGRLVVRGLSCKEAKPAANEFIKLCSTVLKLDVGVAEVNMLSPGKGFLVLLDSVGQFHAVLAARKLLKGSRVFIEKDYTVEERDKRYHLRSLSKKISEDKAVKVRLGDFSLFVNDKPYYWTNGAVMASNEDDALFLREILSRIGYDCVVAVNDHRNKTPFSAQSRSTLNNNSN